MTRQNRTGIRRGLIMAIIATIGIVAVMVLVYSQLIGVRPLSPPTMAFNKLSANAADPAVQGVMDIHPLAQASSDTSTPSALYTSCTVLRGSTPTPAVPGSDAALTEIAINTLAASMQMTRQSITRPAPVGTPRAPRTPTQSTPQTASPTMTTTPAATLAAASTNYTVFQIAGEQSQACYQVGEALIGRDLPFNLAIGVSNAISGQIAIDKSNVANSIVGEVVVDISQLKSDQSARDGQIRNNWLQSNTYPLATFTPTTLTGLPSGPYVDGTPINFQITGTMNVHNTNHVETFTVTATLTGTTLVGTASADVLMTDFGFQPPSIAGFVTANNEAHLILNFVALPVTS